MSETAEELWKENELLHAINKEQAKELEILKMHLWSIRKSQMNPTTPPPPPKNRELWKINGWRI